MLDYLLTFRLAAYTIILLGKTIKAASLKREKIVLNLSLAHPLLTSVVLEHTFKLVIVFRSTVPRTTMNQIKYTYYTNFSHFASPHRYIGYIPTYLQKTNKIITQPTHNQRHRKHPFPKSISPRNSQVVKKSTPKSTIH